MSFKWQQRNVTTLQKFFITETVNRILDHGTDIVDMLWAIYATLKEIVTSDAFKHGITDTHRVRFRIVTAEHEFNGNAVNGRPMLVEDFLYDSIDINDVLGKYIACLNSNESYEIGPNTLIIMQYIDVQSLKYQVERRR